MPCSKSRTRCVVCLKVGGRGDPKTDVAEAASATTAETVMKTIIREGNLEVLMKLLEHFSPSYRPGSYGPKDYIHRDGCEVQRDVKWKEFRVEVESGFEKRQFFLYVIIWTRQYSALAGCCCPNPRKTTLTRDGKGAQMIANAN